MFQSCVSFESKSVKCRQNGNQWTIDWIKLWMRYSFQKLTNYSIIKIFKTYNSFDFNFYLYSENQWLKYKSNNFINNWKREQNNQYLYYFNTNHFNSKIINKMFVTILNINQFILNLIKKEINK